MLAIVLVKSEDKIYIKLNEDNSIIGDIGSKRDEIVRSFEKSFNRNHDRGYEASISTCLHAIKFQYSVVIVPNIEFIDKELIDKDRTILSLSFVAGFCRAISTEQSISVPLFESGIKPRLISAD